MGIAGLIAMRRRWISVAMITIAPAITAAMSLAFYGEVRGAMLITSLVCAVVIERVVDRIAGNFRARLREANATLEARVIERTVELERVNETLRAAAAEQRALRDELMARDRMATAGMLAAGVSHEIRSPLAVIRIAVDEARELATAEGELAERIADISDAATRIELIVRDLSSLARPADDPLGPTDVRAAIDSAARLASYRLGKATRLVTEALDAPAVHANASRLVQVLLNLIINAARASRPDTVNHIAVCARRREDGHVAIAVSDTGTGMSDAVKARLFEPFFTTGQTTGGTGLGLAICRAIVERMGGTITVDSALGVGTTVEIVLARAEAQRATRGPRHESTDPPCRETTGRSERAPHTTT